MNSSPSFNASVTRPRFLNVSINYFQQFELKNDQNRLLKPHFQDLLNREKVVTNVQLKKTVSWFLHVV